MKVSMESPEVKSGNTGQPRATREIPPLYIFSQAGTCPGVPGKDERQLLRGAAHPRHAIRTRPAFIRTRRGCSYPDSAPVGAPPSVRTGASTFSHPGRVLLQRSPHPLHSAGDDAADATHHQPANMGGVGDSTETQYADDPRQTEHQP